MGMLPHGVTLKKMAVEDPKVCSLKMPESLRLIGCLSKRKSNHFHHLVNIIIWSPGNIRSQKSWVHNYFKRRRSTLLTKRPLSSGLFHLKESMKPSIRRRLRKEL